MLRLSSVQRLVYVAEGAFNSDMAGKDQLLDRGEIPCKCGLLSSPSERKDAHELLLLSRPKDIAPV